MSIQLKKSTIYGPHNNEDLYERFWVLRQSEARGGGGGVYHCKEMYSTLGPAMRDVEAAQGSVVFDTLCKVAADFDAVDDEHPEGAWQDHEDLCADDLEHSAFQDALDLVSGEASVGSQRNLGSRFVAHVSRITKDIELEDVDHAFGELKEVPASLFAAVLVGMCVSEGLTPSETRNQAARIEARNEASPGAVMPDRPSQRATRWNAGGRRGPHDLRGSRDIRPL